MPDDPAANIIMICTGTGSAPFRGFTERRRRAMPDAAGRLLLFFGARRPEELPYFGPLQKVPKKLLGKYFCYSRVPNEPRVYVQDRIRAEARQIAPHPDGRFDLATVGADRFRLLRTDTSLPYLQGEVEMLDDDASPADTDQAVAAEALATPVAAARRSSGASP